jgi:hypothetical protein
VMMGMRRVMTDRMWDRMVSSQFQHPEPEA